MAYQSLNQIIGINMNIEERFEQYLNEMIAAFQRPGTKKAFECLRDRLNKDMESIANIQRRDFGAVEFVKEVPDTRIEDYFPELKPDKNMAPMEILGQILEFQEKHLEFYTRLREIVVYDKSKDICDMLAKFKLGQIKGIQKMMEDHELTV